MRVIKFFIIIICFVGVAFGFSDEQMFSDYDMVSDYEMYSDGEPNYNMLYTEDCPRAEFNQCMRENNNEVFTCMFGCGKKTEKDILFEKQLKRELDDANMVSLFECKEGYVPSLLENKCIKEEKDSSEIILSILKPISDLGDNFNDIMLSIDPYIENLYYFLTNREIQIVFFVIVGFLLLFTILIKIINGLIGKYKEDS